MKIKSATISEMPESITDPMPEVTVTLANGTEKKLFFFYPDEIMFTPEEFVGLTVSEAHSLKHQKDVAYLRS
jgi:hypothetical protein